MDCKKADEALLQYAEKTIKPAMAAALARHVLTCESCREMYVAFDEAIENAAAYTDDAPEGFTAAVMDKVRALPPHKPGAVSNAADRVAQVFLCVCAMVMGVGLTGVYNLERVTQTLFTRYPNAGVWAEEAASAVRDRLRAVANGFLQLGAQIGETATPVLEMSALFFAAVIGLLLVVLQRAEPVKS